MYTFRVILCINFEIIALRIIDKTLILCTFPKTCPFPSQEKTLNQNGSDRSYLLCINLETKIKKVEKVVLQKNVISMDRSENEIALLGEDGEILIYTIQANILVPHITLKIKNFDAISFGSQLSLLFSNFNHQLVLKDNWSFNKYYFLSKIGSNKLKIVPIMSNEVDGVIKVYYQKIERIVSISRDKLIFNRNEIAYLTALFLFND